VQVWLCGFGYADLLAGWLRDAGKDRRDEFDLPDWAAVVELTFFLDEGRSLPAENPDMDVRGLLTDDGGDDAGNAPKINLDAVVRCLVTNASDGERVFALGSNHEMDEARFGARCHHGESDRWGTGIEVQQQNHGKTVANVGTEIKVVQGGFPVFVVGGDLAAGGIDEHVERFGKRGPALDVMVADELKDFTLRRDGGLVIEGTIAKVVGQAGRDPIPVGNLNKIAAGEGTAL
jgi:hypothetical protein